MIDSNFKLYTFKSIVIFRALICKFDLFLKNFDKVSNDDNCIMHVLKTDCLNVLWNLLRSSHCEYTIHVLFFDKLLWNSHKVNSFQSRWTKTIIYRVICDEMFVANFWFMFAYSNSVEMFCQKTLYFAIYDRVCTLIYNEML